jgi:hypothetical protein
LDRRVRKVFKGLQELTVPQDFLERPVLKVTQVPWAPKGFRGPRVLRVLKD